MHVPVSTYRLQLHAGFPFAAAAEVSSYLARLGAGTCYTSPYFAAMPGSTHGYDVSDHNAINPELGGANAHALFTARLSALGLGHIVDFVPNHMGIGTAANLWWRDVLENGPGSPAARFFDVDWTPVKAALHAKVLLPILGDQYGRVLERGELALEFLDGRLVVRYADHELPINPKHAPQVLRLSVGPLTEALGADNPQLHEFLSILTSLQNLPGNTEQDPSLAAERQREKEVARARLARLVADSPIIGGHIDAAVRETNGEVGRPESFDGLHDLLEAQVVPAVLLADGVARDQLPPLLRRQHAGGPARRGSAGVRGHTRAAVAARRRGQVQGVRVDHPDGLFDPTQVLQHAAGTLAGGDLLPSSSRRRSCRAARRCRRAGRCRGTTGYNFLNDLNGLFVNGAEARRLRRVYTKLTGRTDPFDDVLYESKRLIMETAMASELNVLAHVLDAHRRRATGKSRDFTLDSLRDALTEVVACFPVYRTYVDECGWTPGDRAVLVARRSRRARRRNPAMESLALRFRPRGDAAAKPEESDEATAHDRRAGYPPADAAEARERLRFAMKFQQYTGPVHAKGVEDTAFFRYNLLLSLNEVGGDPERIGRTVEEFHQANARRLETCPHEMLATATHDTKLGEDTRARVNVISEMPDQWSREVGRWMRLNRAHRTIVDDEPAPDRNDEYRFYQSWRCAGIWPFPGQPDRSLVDRLKAYMLKSVKEAKLHTSWLSPNEEYENAVATFVERTLTGAGAAKFVPAFTPLARRIAHAGMTNGLAQVVLKLGSPGVPDFYQGTELWDFSLVDPDNRRPVDFADRADALAGVGQVLSLPHAERGPRITDMIASWPDGRIKLLLTTAGLCLRREWPDVFLSGRYIPLKTESAVPAGLVAFARVLGTRVVLVVAPRLVAPLVSEVSPVPLGGDAWKTSRILLPPSSRATRSATSSPAPTSSRPTAPAGGCSPASVRESAGSTSEGTVRW